MTAERTKTISENVFSFKIYLEEKGAGAEKERISKFR